MNRRDLVDNNQASYEFVDLRYKASSRGDKVFFGVSRVAAYFAFSIVFLIVIFLGNASASTFRDQGLGFFTGSTWDEGQGIYQIFPMLVGSVFSAFIGLVIATPISIAIAYFTEFMAPTRLAKVLTNVIDLLAALPSIVVAIWAAFVFAPVAAQWSQLLHSYLGSIPGFKNTTEQFLGSPFIAGWVLAIMMTPIITSVAREMIGGVDKDLVSSAYALGGTRFTTMRRVVLPTARGGITGGILLGLGRGIGETIAVLYVLNLSFVVNLNMLESYGGSVAPMIAAYLGEASPSLVSVLLAAGVALFLVTLFVNMVAQIILSRSERKMAS
jgi:phosphate transport system permease protein